MNYDDDEEGTRRQVKDLLNAEINRRVELRLEEERRHQLLEDYIEQTSGEYEGRFSDNRFLNFISWSLYITGIVIFSPILIPWKLTVFICRPFLAAFRRLR